MRLQTMGGIVLSICLLWVVTPARGDQDQERIGRLVQQLGAASEADRDAATKELLEIGAPAAAALEQAAKGDDPEVSTRAKAILKVVRPLALLASPDRQKRIKVSLAICDSTKVYTSGEFGKNGFRVTDGPAMIQSLCPAVRANPDLMNEYIQACLRQAGQLLDGAAKAEFEASDVGRWLAGDMKKLSDAHPASELAGKVLYAAGKYEEYLRQFPQGFYAPRARYCLIAAKKTYTYSEYGRGEPTTFAHPDRELAAWPDFLKNYPDFEGADDANYRYARVLEIRGKLDEACLRLRLRYPDGDMENSTLERLLFIMDARMDARQLAAVGRAFEQDKRSDAELLVPAAHMAVVVEYLAALKLWRDGKYAAAAAGLREAATQADGLVDKAAPAVAPRGEGGEDLGAHQLRQGSLPQMIVRRSGALAEHCDTCAALVDKADGEKLYELASLIYKAPTLEYPGKLRSTGSWLSSYYASEGPPEFFAKSSKYWQAARLYKKVLDEYPRCASATKALYMLANCHCHVAEIGRSEFWLAYQKDNVKKAIELYGRFAEQNPDHELTPRARKAVEFLTHRWIDGKADDEE